MPGVSLMKKICSYHYTKLADVELDPEPQVESEDIEFAMEHIGSIDGLLGPTPINLETLSASPRCLRQVYMKIP
jgi:hypothetical protein